MKIETAEQFRTALAPPGGPSGYTASAPDVVRTYQPLVRKLAWLVHGRAARSAELDDLVQVGMMALIEASRSYQDQGHSFGTYATIRIRGAMVDYVRRGSPVGRAAVAASRRLGLARQRLEQMLHRAPAASEVADELGMTAQDFFAFEQLGSRTSPTSLEEADGPAAHIIDHCQQGADDVSEAAELINLLTRSVAMLTPREQTILQLFFHEELNLAEIGAVLGVSAARVCQIKAAALRKLGASMHSAA
jgi:RNA polymerase sigma factor FliA